MVINSPCLIDKRELAIPGQTTTGKEFLNPLMAESLVRSDLLFDDEDGITCLTNDEIFENLALMGYEPLSTKITFQKGGGDSVERAITTDASLVAAHDSDNINKTQTTATPNVDLPQGMDTCGSPRRQETMGVLLLRLGGYTPGSDEGRLKLLELMNTCTSLLNRVTILENKLSSTKAVYHKAFITLTKRVKKLGTQLKYYARDWLPRKIKKREMIQLSLDEELAQKLHAEELAKETARQEQERVFSKSEVRKNMRTYLKNQGGYKQSYFKGMKYEDIRPIFERKLDEQTEDEVEAQADTDQEIKEMKLFVKIVPDEDIAIDVIPLATKPPVIVEYKIVKEGKISTYHIIRADGSIKRYTLMIRLLENIDREDLETLWKLVKDKHGNTRLEEDYKRVLWGDIKVMFEPDIESEVKAEHQRPSGLLQQPEIPKWKWIRIAMDFVTKLPRTSSGHDTIWVIMDRLTKSAHFLPMREDYKMDRLARLYLNEIVAWHSVPISIIFDRDSRLTSSDNDYEIHYHPGKANVVADTLRLLRGLDEMIERMSDGVLYYLDPIWVPLKGDVRTMIMDEAYKSNWIWRMVEVGYDVLGINLALFLVKNWR
nr:putative reverse transcriptase domain-containing protein [Tanacetum cinerariifolium]